MLVLLLLMLLALLLVLSLRFRLGGWLRLLLRALAAVGALLLLASWFVAR